MLTFLRHLLDDTPFPAEFDLAVNRQELLCIIIESDTPTIADPDMSIVKGVRHAAAASPLVGGHEITMEGKESDTIEECVE